MKSGINGIWMGGSDIADKNTGIWKWTDGSRCKFDHLMLYKFNSLLSTVYMCL